MPEFSKDWSDSIVHWPALFADLDLVGKPGLRFLEVGCFEGRTTLWLLGRSPDSRVDVVDPFLEIPGQYARFARNVEVYGDRVCAHVGASGDVLRGFGSWADGLFDFIYIDGSHVAEDVLQDAVLAWPLLRDGGAMVFDDYYWPGRPELETPRIAVDAFVACYARQIAARSRSGRDQYLVVKT